MIRKCHHCGVEEHDSLMTSLYFGKFYFCRDCTRKMFRGPHRKPFHYFLKDEKERGEEEKKRQKNDPRLQKVMREMRIKQLEDDKEREKLAELKKLVEEEIKRLRTS